MTKSNEEHPLTRAAIKSQVVVLNGRRGEITKELTAICQAALRSGSAMSAPAVSGDEMAARDHAKRLLNGNAPAFLSRAAERSREKSLLIERRGIDIALEFLTRQEGDLAASEAVAWANAHLGEWRELCAELVLARVRLEALERRADEMISLSGDARLPMVAVVGRPDISTREFVDAALAARLLAQNEIERAASLQPTTSEARKRVQN